MYQDKIRLAPDTSGMKNEVIFQKSHRFGYDHAIRNVGAKIIEVETRQQLDAAVNDKTAMLFFLNSNDAQGQIQRQEFAQIAKRKGIPCLIDAAADITPAENLSAYIKMGFDLVAFSGGKGLRGPQCSGLLLGRKDLIQAAFLNGSPNSDSVHLSLAMDKLGLYFRNLYRITFRDLYRWQLKSLQLILLFV